MKKRVLIVVTTLLLAVAGLTVAQQNPTPPVPEVGVVPPPPASVLPLGFAHKPSPDIATPPMAKEVKPEDLTIEQLIEAMEKTRDEIAEREKKNNAMLKVLQDKVNKLKVRMDSFTGKPEPATPIPAPGQSLFAEPARVPAGDLHPPAPANRPAPKQP